MRYNCVLLYLVNPALGEFDGSGIGIEESRTSEEYAGYQGALSTSLTTVGGSEVR